MSLIPETPSVTRLAKSHLSSVSGVARYLQRPSLSPNSLKSDTPLAPHSPEARQSSASNVSNLRWDAGGMNFTPEQTEFGSTKTWEHGECGWQQR